MRLCLPNLSIWVAQMGAACSFLTPKWRSRDPVAVRWSARFPTHSVSPDMVKFVQCSLLKGSFQEFVEFEGSLPKLPNKFAKLYLMLEHDAPCVLILRKWLEFFTFCSFRKLLWPT